MTDASPARWIRIKQIVAELIEQEPESRPASIERACGGDPVLRGEVEALLRAHDRAGAFLEAPALASSGAARVVVDATDPPAAERPLPDRFGAYRVLKSRFRDLSPHSPSAGKGSGITRERAASQGRACGVRGRTDGGVQALVRSGSTP